MLTSRSDGNSLTHILAKLNGSHLTHLKTCDLAHWCFCVVVPTTGAAEHTGEDLADAENSSQKRETPESWSSLWAKAVGWCTLIPEDSSAVSSQYTVLEVNGKEGVRVKPPGRPLEMIRNAHGFFKSKGLFKCQHLQICLGYGSALPCFTPVNTSWDLIPQRENFTGLLNLGGKSVTSCSWLQGKQFPHFLPRSLPNSSG